MGRHPSSSPQKARQVLHAFRLLFADEIAEALAKVSSTQRQQNTGSARDMMAGRKVRPAACRSLVPGCRGEPSRVACSRRRGP